jgi:hypothetical protein
MASISPIEGPIGARLATSQGVSGAASRIARRAPR